MFPPLLIFDEHFPGYSRVCDLEPLRVFFTLCDMSQIF